MTPELKETIDIQDFLKLDLRVATILEAEPHPNADKLLKLQIDLGFEKRQICAGIKAHYNVEDLPGKQIIVVANLKEKPLRGEPSKGMLLAASEYEGETVQDVILLSPSKPASPGSPVG